ncbi:dTMP kinase [Gryllotalpicola ginsengisoli]|uniref:dTMP kinase n=1 Tax=Gryllotalpicola ginsengisoli TaxID=444608 RepID=UPI0003B66BF3|nr:dTMP kinase [Gryllotalpicola ginsengisoli]
MTAGLYLTVEGLDGSGKTTQIDRLAAWLTDAGRTVTATREPGGTEVGQLIRDIVLHHRGDIAPRAEALLFAADRAHHIATKVRPALERGDVVVQDRYIDSSVAFQGAGRVLDPAEVRRLSEWATGGLYPRLTILLDLDPAAARERLVSAQKAYDRIEAEALEFSERIRAAYLAMAQADSERWAVLDATEPADRIAARIRERVEPLLTGGESVGPLR